MNFTREMELEIEKDNNAHQKRFAEKLATLKALNYNYTGEYEKAIAIDQKKYMKQFASKNGFVVT